MTEIPNLQNKRPNYLLANAVASQILKPEARATTSASNIYRRKLCPGSGQLERGLLDEENDYSGEGQMLHKLFLTGERPEMLSPEQVETLDAADRYANEFFEHMMIKFNIPEDAEHVDEREVSLRFHRPTNLEVLFPGHADVIRKWPAFPDVYALVDAKFGFMEVEHAADNYQLASYAVMLWQALPTVGIGVCITQPRNFGPRTSRALYVRSGLMSASKELADIYDASQKPDAPLIAGEVQCHFCKAKTICPAYQEKFMGLTLIGKHAVATLENDKLVEVWEAIRFALKIDNPVSAEMKRRVSSGELIGFKMQNTGDQSHLDNAIGLYKALVAYFDGTPDRTPGFTASAYDGCRVMGWKKLETLVQSLTGLSEKKVKKIVREISTPYVTRVPKEKSVVLDKTAAKIGNKLAR